MKVIVLPGINFTLGSNHEYFVRQVGKKLSCDCQLFKWEKEHHFPDYGLPYKDLRQYFCGAVTDFQEVILHASEINPPEADVYIGHSAGSIVALVQDKPCVIMASPASLIETIGDDDSYDVKIRDKIRIIMDKVRGNLSANLSILDIYNAYDIVAYPFKKPNVENYKYKNSWYSPSTYSPVAAHGDYWENDKVIDKIVRIIKKWQI